MFTKSQANRHWIGQSSHAGTEAVTAITELAAQTRETAQVQ